MRKLFLGLLLTTNFANANTFNLQDFGEYTFDKNSGLEWLDTSFTVGKSYNEVIGMTSSGNSLEGWRFATYDEFTYIFTSRGYSFIGTSKITANVPSQTNDPFFITFINLLGATDINSTTKDILGLTSEDYKGLREDSQYYGFIRSGYNASNITSYASFSRYEDNSAGPTIASFLVRSVSPIPETDTWVMLLTGLISLGVSIKTRRNSLSTTRRTHSIFGVKSILVKSNQLK